MSQSPRLKAEDVLTRVRAFLHGNPNLTDVWPMDERAEKAVVGGLFALPKECAAILTTKGVTADYFYDPKCQIVAKAIIELLNSGVAVDFITLTNKLTASKHIEGVGIPFLHELTGDYTGINFNHHLEIVIEKYALRYGAMTGIAIAGRCMERQDDFKTLLTELQRMAVHVAGIGSKASDLQIRDQVAALINKRLQDANPGLEGLSTHIPELDQYTGGIRDGHLVMLAGHGKNKKSSGSGKTTFATDIFRHMIHEHQRPAIMLEMEMNAEDLIYRMVSAWSGIPCKHITQKRVNDDQEKVIADWLAWLASTKAKIEDSGRMTLSQVTMKLRAFKANNPAAKLAVIDYFQLIELPGRKEWSVAQISKEKSNTLKGLARELGMCIIALSQLNKAGDAAEGKVLHEDADSVWIVEHDDDGAFLKLDKNRHGDDRDEDGNQVRIPLQHDRECVRFLPVPKKM